MQNGKLVQAKTKGKALVSAMGSAFNSMTDAKAKQSFKKSIGK